MAPDDMTQGEPEFRWNKGKGTIREGRDRKLSLVSDHELEGRWG